MKILTRSPIHWLMTRTLMAFGLAASAPLLTGLAAMSLLVERMSHGPHSLQSF